MAPIAGQNSTPIGSKKVRAKPWCEIDERDYLDAEAIYEILLRFLQKLGEELWISSKK
jgi:hypothetical protein